MDVTSDLRDFGYRELKMAAELLTAYKTDDDETELLGDGVRVMFNKMSANVFLTDEDYNVAMMNGDTLEDWHVCGYCGEEGFAEDLFAEDSDHYRDRWGGIGCGDEPEYVLLCDDCGEEDRTVVMVPDQARFTGAGIMRCPTCGGIVAHWDRDDMIRADMIRADDDACPDDPDGLHHVGCGCE